VGTSTSHTPKAPRPVEGKTLALPLYIYLYRNCVTTPHTEHMDQEIGLFVLGRGRTQTQDAHIDKSVDSMMTAYKTTYSSDTMLQAG
jgi:hypothetical protein